MNGLIIGALAALSMVQQQTDTIIDIGDARELAVETLGGSIEVGVWDEDRVRVQAEHSNRTYIDFERHENGREIHVEAEARRGPANIVDFRITVPRWFALELEATYGDIVISGAEGEVQAETVQGDVTILGGRGQIEVEATTGNILVEGADGVIDIESSAADIRVLDATGEIYAETAGGTIVLERVRPRAVDVGSTGGRVHYDGALEPGGTYFFGAHGGSITIVVPEDAQADFNVATVHGSISSNLSGQAQSLKGGERHEFSVGGGGAIVEAETYGGRIRILRAGSEGASAPTPRRNRAPDGAAMADGWQGYGDPDVDVHVDPDWDYDYDYDYDYDWNDGTYEWRGGTYEWNGEVPRASGHGARDGRHRAPDLASRVSARVTPTVASRVGRVVSARVAPVVAVDVASAVAPAVAVEVGSEIGWLKPPRAVSETPATIRR